ncbi:hypothetical protein PK98_11335 [Croceibacterium mercuriale]|uniref:Uncharacterized protein n=1 Tax=Croceibacterium mercuriale TaxID=1572751 RepID=A0A0B2BX45_9SPHN|nr:hypothetical protein PK98_11335 [Croceibacterium mercuriale]
MTTCCWRQRRWLARRCAGIERAGSRSSCDVRPVRTTKRACIRVAGQYQFRAGASYRPVSLTEYVTACYAVYAAIPAEQLTPFPEFRAQVDHIATLL